MSHPASAEDVVLKGAVTDVFGHRIVMQSENKKFLVNIGPKLEEIGALKAGDAVSVEGDLTRSGEVRAQTVTLADGRKVVVGKDKQTWKEWLLGEDSDDGKMFTAAEAKKLAVEKGYALTSEPVAEKKHFVAKATKDGKAYDLDLHRDGRIEEKTAFGIEDAKKEIVAKGYDIIGEPQKIKQHYEALARKSSQYFEVHAHRDGEVKEARKIDKTDPKWGAQIP